MRNNLIIFYLFVVHISLTGQSQLTKNNYIKYYNFANEAVYNFYELNYIESVQLFEKAFKYGKIRKPDHHYNYCRALWEVGKNKKALKELKKSYFSLYFLSDSTYFESLSEQKRLKIVRSMQSNINTLKLKQPHIEFLDSINKKDQEIRRILVDSIIPYYSEISGDTMTQHYERLMVNQDKLNGNELIRYSRQNGFPAGINANWNESISTILLHLGRDWILDNYFFLIEELKKGNIEPWMFARCIDRFFAKQPNENQNVITPYNSYFGDNSIDPFLLFMNRKSIGLSPYYEFHRKLYPKGWRPYPTEQYEIYHMNKSLFNTTL